MKIYVASSWRNENQQYVVEALREAGHDVYDFKNPAPGKKGFAWSDIDPEWKEWTNREFTEALKHPIADQGFDNDFDAMQWADACVMVMPCGRSAHVQAGWMQGAGKPTIVLLTQAEPELMYKMFSKLAINMDDVLEHLNYLEKVEFLSEGSNSNQIEVKKTDTFFYISPESGHPDCKCSRCDKAIPEDESPILRMWPSEPGDHGYDPKALGGTELRYCWACSKEMGVDFGNQND